MPWVKIDDAFWRHRKTRKAWREPRAVGLFVMALCHSNEGLEDGFVSPEWVEMQLAPKDRERVTQALVEAGLWEPFGDGWQIHDYFDYQPSRAKVESVQEAKRLAGALGGRATQAAHRRANGEHR